MNRESGTGPTGRAVAVTGVAVTTGYGQGIDALRDGIYSGVPAFVPVTRFDTSRYRVGVAAQADPGLDLDTELVALTEEACKQAGLSQSERADAPLVVARHADPAVSRLPREDQESRPISDTAQRLSRELGLGGAGRTYINACVAASSALADAAALISSGRNDRVVVAAGHLVDAESFTTFDAGKAMAADGRLRPFSSGRKGLLLGDGAGAVVLEAVDSRTGMRPLARLTGWGMAGDAHHVCRPHPRGLGMARAIGHALDRAGLGPEDLDYVNAHGTGTPSNDAAETAAMHRAFGEHAERIPSAPPSRCTGTPSRPRAWWSSPSACSPWRRGACRSTPVISAPIRTADSISSSTRPGSVRHGMCSASTPPSGEPTQRWW